MTTYVDSRDTKARSVASDEVSPHEEQLSQYDWELLSTLQSAQPIDDGAEYIDGLPLALVKTYAEIAVRHATVKEIEPGHWFASVVGLEGAWGDGETPQEALSELDDAIVGWVAVKRRSGATDIPPMEGIDLNPPE